MMLYRPILTEGKPSECPTCHRYVNIVETDENERLENQCVWKCTCCGQRFYEKEKPHIPNIDIVYLCADFDGGWMEVSRWIDIAYNIRTQERVIKLSTGWNRWTYVDIPDDIIKQAFTPMLVSQYILQREYPYVFDAGGINIYVSRGRFKNEFKAQDGYYRYKNLKKLFELIYSDEWYEVPPPLVW